jgi:hypothetical protein
MVSVASSCCAEDHVNTQLHGECWLKLRIISSGGNVERKCYGMPKY